MSDMLDYSLAMLSAISDMLATPPIIYIVGFLLLGIIVKIFLSIIRWPATRG